MKKADENKEEIGHEITPVKGVKNLCAMEIDPDEATRKYKERTAGLFRDIMPVGAFAYVEQQLNSPCNKEMAALERFVQSIESRDYDVVIFDTAPTRHTLKPLSPPFDCARQMEVMVSSSIPGTLRWWNHNGP